MYTRTSQRHPAKDRKRACDGLYIRWATASSNLVLSLGQYRKTEYDACSKSPYCLACSQQWSVWLVPCYSYYPLISNFLTTALYHTSPCPHFLSSRLKAAEHLLPVSQSVDPLEVASALVLLDHALSFALHYDCYRHQATKAIAKQKPSK